MKKLLLLLIISFAFTQAHADGVCICYCKDASHATPVVLAVSDTDGTVEAHGLHTLVGELRKEGLTYADLIAAHGEGLFAYLETTYGDEMI